MRAPTISRLGAALGSVISILVPTSYSSNIIDLSSQKWTLSNNAYNISVAGKVPSHVHLDLQAARIIDDPYCQHYSSTVTTPRPWCSVIIHNTSVSSPQETADTR